MSISVVLDFEIPNARQRFELLNKSITTEFKYDKDVDLEYISKNHELTAASIWLKAKVVTAFLKKIYYKSFIYNVNEIEERDSRAPIYQILESE